MKQKRWRTSPIRILVVEDHVVLGEIIVRLLEMQAGLIPVARVATVVDAIESAGRLQPDLVLLDLSLPDGSGLGACRAILQRCPQTRILIHTVEAAPGVLHRADLAGAHGYVVKGSSFDRLLAAIRFLSSGHPFVDLWFTEPA